MRDRVGIFVVAFAVICGVVTGTSSPAAQRPLLTDGERLRQCGRDLCDIVNERTASGPDIACNLAETWHQDVIAKAVGRGHLSWPFGDARCSMTLAVSRALLAPALTEASYKLKVPPQPVRCEVDNGDRRHEVKGNMAPEIEFEGGKAKSVSLGLQDIDGNVVVRNAVWAAWKFESTFGFFQKDFVKAVNDYIGVYCPASAKKER